MDDWDILELYRNRSEEAVRETEIKYGRYLFSIAFGILENHESSSECVNDALLNAWKAIPPAEPQVLQTYLGRITRNLALDRSRHENAEKRGSGRICEVLDELYDLSDEGSETEKMLDRIAVQDLLKRFLLELKKKDRMVFVKRYWYFMSAREISEEMDIRESNVNVILHRCRKALKERLKEEGFEL